MITLPSFLNFRRPAAKAAVPREAKPQRERILIIRLGALGDLVLCFQTFHEIREAHKDAEIALLTAPAFAAFAGKIPWFDRIIVDPRKPAWDLPAWVRLIREIRRFKPTRVYDLQAKLRQNLLYVLLGGPLGPEWSGAAPFCSHPRFDPPAPGMHVSEFWAAQLQLADVPAQPPADLKWLDVPLDGFILPPRFAVLIPGCAPHREYKRWPASKYAELAQKLREKDIASIAVGTSQDAGAISALRVGAPQVADFSGRTSLFQLAAILRRATCVIANDTGPAHIAAAVGAPTLVLMSEQVDAAWSAPRGPRSAWLQGKPLATLGADKVLLALANLVDRTGS